MRGNEIWERSFSYFFQFLLHMMNEFTPSPFDGPEILYNLIWGATSLDTQRPLYLIVENGSDVAYHG